MLKSFMKNLRVATVLFFSAAIFLPTSAEVQEGNGILYLNNGSAIEGKISADLNKGKYTIITPQGNVYEYNRAEVRTVKFGQSSPAAANSGTKAAHPEGTYTDHNSLSSGFWGAAESVTGYSCRLNNSNFGFEEIDFIGGYRLNEYFRAGVGIGARYYFDNNKVRTTHIKWAMPIFLNVRGGFMPNAYRTVTPFYSFDIGGCVRDGFMMRPALGLKIGNMRSAFTIALAYNGQSMKVWKLQDAGFIKKQSFTSFIALKLGYEY